MKIITVSAEDGLFEQAQALATARQTTLEQLCHDWLAQWVGAPHQQEQVTALFQRLDYVRSGGPHTRDEMNER